MKGTLRHKIIISAALMLVLALLFTSCSGGIDTEEAKGDLLAFFDALRRGEDSQAEALLHPDGDSLEDCLDTLRDCCGTDPHKGILVTGYLNFAYSYYHSDVDGSRYILTAEAKIEGKDFLLCVVFVRNDGGYGIFEFDTVE